MTPTEFETSDLDQPVAPAPVPPAPQDGTPVSREQEKADRKQARAETEDREERQRVLSNEQADRVEPSAELRQWDLFGAATDGTTVAKSYTQGPLGFFNKIELYELWGQELEALTEIGGEDIDLRTIFRFRQMLPEKVDDISDEQNVEVMDWIKLAARVFGHRLRPFLQRNYMIWLAVPRRERDWATEAMSRPPHEGGFTDDQGFELAATFVKQNGQAIRDFFSKEGRWFVDLVMDEFDLNQPQETEPELETATEKQ